MTKETVDSWNKKHAIGTRVMCLRHDAHLQIACTTGPAVWFGKQALVPLGRLLGLMPIQRVKVLQSEAAQQSLCA